MLRKTIILLFLVAFSSCRHLSSFPPYDIHKTASGSNGMVVTSHPLASVIGMEILRKGGNAADAAIAVQFALAVVYPKAGNIGGGGFLVYRNDKGEITTLDYRERAPLGAYRDMFLDSTGRVIKGKSTNGILSAGVPGTVAGLAEMYKKLGKLKPWSALVEPAIQLAENGFRITEKEAGRLNDHKIIFSSLNPAHMPFLKSKKWKEGDMLVQKDLAKTLRLIADLGRDGFYSGANAERLEKFSKAKNGLITKNDLKTYDPVWRQPLTFTWRGFTIHTMGLPSSGGIVLEQILKMVEHRLVDSLGYRDPYNVHLLVEAERRAFEDRAKFLGDADFVHVPVDSILSDEYLELRFSDFNPDVASKSKTFITTDPSTSKEHLETTHISIADAEGNAASVTTTLNDNYGSKVWVPGGGYFLNDEMDDFSVKPGVPNIFGLIGAEANSIAPGKRMLSSMTPVIIEKDGKLWMLLGSPGGSMIISSVLQVFLNVAAFGMNLDDAVQSLRYHHQWLPDEIKYEKNAFSPELIQTLISMGYTLKPAEIIGMIEAIQVDDQGMIHGTADHRGDDHASGW